jgi:hypothetical protein
MDRVLEEFKYVNKVVSSCTTLAQLNSAKKWAEEWSKRMKILFPEDISSYIDLYLQVIEKRNKKIIKK